MLSIQVDDVEVILVVSFILTFKSNEVNKLTNFALCVVTLNRSIFKSADNINFYLDLAMVERSVSSLSKKILMSLSGVLYIVKTHIVKFVRRIVISENSNCFSSNKLLCVLTFSKEIFS